MGEEGFGHPCLLWYLAKHKSCPPGHASQPSLGSRSTELLLALCGACFLAEEILSAGGAFLSRKGLASSRQGTAAESSTAAIGARSQHVAGPSLPLIHPGTGCLVWTGYFSRSVVRDGQPSRCGQGTALRPGSAEARCACLSRAPRWGLVLPLWHPGHRRQVWGGGCG